MYKTLKEKYAQLPRKDKETIGIAMVKVNLGVGVPEDIKIVASFLKGTSVVAKEGGLDALIEFLNEDERSQKKHKMDAYKETQTLSDIQKVDETLMNELKQYNEDDVDTIIENSKNLRH